ncbi:hypothetical protein DPMN_067719 [Dreissena polymorpha]|uniref:Uncharacterized protein n=1 Tax=Dreissena polymorpha TaxID=45954 RepID=A0A9D4BTS1_DREPO|nr:hypothetical protein DPMN_067719 [Dreissena polymorpha]
MPTTERIYWPALTSFWTRLLCYHLAKGTPLFESSLRNQSLHKVRGKLLLNLPLTEVGNQHRKKRNRPTEMTLPYNALEVCMQLTFLKHFVRKRGLNCALQHSGRLHASWQ